MSKITTNIEPRGELWDKATALLSAAMDYWEAYRKAGLFGAVVWVQDGSGRLVILTRGEYRHVLMENIPKLTDAVEFGCEGVPG